MRISTISLSTLFFSLSLFVCVGAAEKIDRSAAPADEYFGPQKMSALSIRMRIDELGRRYHARTISDADLVHDASLADAALHAWRDRYPRDPWLAPTAFHLEQLFGAVQSPEARADATTELHYIVANFGTTRYGHLSRLRLAQGFPALRSETATVATPNPYASAAASSPASELPSSVGSATAPASSAKAQPSSAPTASPAH